MTESRVAGVSPPTRQAVLRQLRDESGVTRTFEAPDPGLSEEEWSALMDSEPAPNGEGPVVSMLEFLSAAELVRRVNEAPGIGFLVRPVWPADAYGVLAAQHKAGKTWAALDLVVSVASGTPWLDIYSVDRAGPVVAFCGEGGERKTARRLQAICAARGLALEELPIEFCFRAPHLTNALAIAAVAEKLAELRPVLVLIDPLYLAARGAKSASLYDMGTHLENIQTVVQHAGAALVIVHHWNQTGVGVGAERMSGAGPAEWGRVLVSVRVEANHTDTETGTTAVTLAWSFVGDEIPDTELRLRRRVWADDPDDLDSELHYELERLTGRPAGDETEDGLRPAERRVLAVLRAASMSVSVQEIGDALVGDDTGLKPLRARTIQAALQSLQRCGLADSDQLSGRAHAWWAQTTDSEAEDAL